MKKIILYVLLVIVGSLGFGALASAQSTNNFTISSFDAKMKLSRDDEKHSKLEVTETIVADFPEFDQNHGLERAFVKEYDGHKISFELGSVTNEHGDNLEHSWNGDSLRIGNADTFVHGRNTYVISYTMRDVTRYFDDVNRDELYWDVLGTDWQVPISQARVNLEIDPDLQSLLTENKACYIGSSGSTDSCELAQQGLEFTTQSHQLSPGQGITIAIGFEPGTFAPYKRTLIEQLAVIWIWMQVIGTPLAVIYLILLLTHWGLQSKRKNNLGTVVPEYIPPKEASVTTSARVGKYSGSAMTAQMLDLAVRHYIKIYEVKEKRIMFPAEYEIEISRDISQLRQEEQELLKDMFGSLPVSGQRLNLNKLKNNNAYYKRTLNNNGDLDKLIRGEYQLEEPDEQRKKLTQRNAKWSLVFTVLFLSPAWLIVAIVLYEVAHYSWQLTEKGLSLKRYLEGLKLYISVAETERIKLLQSPDGAEKVRSITTDDVAKDPKLLVKLYERVLPYAVLFGQEKEWNKQLGSYYESAGSSPDWYAGQSAFNATMFSSAMSNFSQANTSVSSYSSSSGGSAGGGFSGGGGGGGGGGGW